MQNTISSTIVAAVRVTVKSSKTASNEEAIVIFQELIASVDLLDDAANDISRMNRLDVAAIRKLLISPEARKLLLMQLDSTKFAGPVVTHFRILKLMATEIIPPLAILFNYLLVCGEVQDDHCHLTPKNSSKQANENCWPIVLTPIVCKIMNHFNRLYMISSAKQCFVKAKSCLAHLLMTLKLTS